VKTISMLLLLAGASLSAMAQTDLIINSSINAFVPREESSFLGFIIAPAEPGSDVDVVILAEGEGDFDSVLDVYLDSTEPESRVAGSDDWILSSEDFPVAETTAAARECFEDLYTDRLSPLDSMVLLSVTVPEGGVTRSIFAEVRGYEGAAGQVNLQLLQVNGPLAGTCPDF